MGEIIRLDRTAGRDDARGYASAQAVRQFAAGITHARSAIKAHIAMLAGLAEMCAAFKRLDAEINAGRVTGVRKVSLEISGGLDLTAIEEVARIVSRQLDLLRVSAEGVEIVKPAMVAGENGEGESK
ncbi:MAG: hypothetical protein IT566_16635 [Rhodospirillaceae bacterium]|nr:hypothetical protein [Rhodospirillaceae bacterium]